MFLVHLLHGLEGGQNLRCRPQRVAIAFQLGNDLALSLDEFSAQCHVLFCECEMTAKQGPIHSRLTLPARGRLPPSGRTASGQTPYEKVSAKSLGDAVTSDQKLICDGCGCSGVRISYAKVH